MLNITTYYRTRSYHLTLNRRAVIKSLQIPNVGDGVEKRDPGTVLKGLQIGATTVQHSMGAPQKSKGGITP